MVCQNLISKCLFGITFLLFSTFAFSQRSHSIGLYIGGSSYLGDVNPSLLFYRPSLAIGGVYRYNVNPHYSLKSSLIRCKVDAADNSFGDFKYQTLRAYSTNNIWMVELAEMIEFNFLPLDMEKNNNKFSPYMEFGLAGFYANLESNTLHISVPMGAGVKYRLTKRIELSLDWCFRKTFTDNLDGLGATFGSRSISKNKQMSITNTNDWYYTYGVSFLYHIKSKKKCQGYSDK